MTATMPALFVSHGSPTLVIEPNAAHDFLCRLGTEVPWPRAILAVSAHWETVHPTVATAERPATIHDFGNFAPELFQIRYPAPGAPQIAESAAGLLDAAGFEVHRDQDRGFDHGTWVPLKLAYPQADIPVAQLSIQPARDPQHHYRLGRALEPLRDEDVLVFASGSLTHNLEALFADGMKARREMPEWVSGFAEWVAACVEDGRIEDLLDYRRRAPFAVENHPSDEHLLPLFVALGAAGRGDWRGRRMHASQTYGYLAMDAYAFG